MSVLKDLPANQMYTARYAESVLIPRRVRTSACIALEFDQRLPFIHREQEFDDYADQVLLPYKQSQNGPFLASRNMGDDHVLFVGGAAGQAGALFVRSKGGNFIAIDQPAFIEDAAYEDQEALFFDLEGDGDLDLYVTSGSSEFMEHDPLLRDRMYLNSGGWKMQRSTEALPDDIRINGQCIEGFDADKDGDTDLFIGGRLIAGAYPLPASSVLLINDKGILRNRTQDLAPGLKEIGLVTDAVADDIDNDGDTDLIIVGEWMTPCLLLNNTSAFEVKMLENPGIGIWWTIEKGDFDKDGDNDFILGNLGWNQKFGGEKPKLKVYSADFDDNGDNDVVLAKKVGDKELPYRGRECSSEEMPFIATKFPTYDAFAKAHLNDILSDERLDNSMHATIKTFSSVYLRNDGRAVFSSFDLPAPVQTGAVKAITIADFNGDGNMDMAFFGNHFPVEVETARYDGLMHGVCLGDGKGGFAFRVFSSDVPLMADYRDVVMSNRAEGFEFVLAQNNGPVMSYMLRTDTTGK
jgi:hypothetical protein